MARCKVQSVVRAAPSIFQILNSLQANVIAFTGAGVAGEEGEGAGDGAAATGDATERGDEAGEEESDEDDEDAEAGAVKAESRP